MRIKYEKGDVFASPYRFILHGCNAQGVMGAGFARQIRDKYPFAYKEYVSIHQKRGLILGETQVVKCRDRIIINAVIQEFYGRDPGKRYVSYDAIANSLSLIEDALYGETIAMPMIGAGLGGGDWKVIEAIIESELKTVQPVIFTLDI